MNISFFGASVTQQSIDRNGNSTGYVQEFRKLLNKMHRDKFSIYQYGYGSNHLDDAGLIYLSDILENNPDIVFLDWHSTGLGSFDEKAYSYIQRKLLSKNIKVVNLILPRRSCIDMPERTNIMQARGYQREGSHFLNLYNHIGRDIDINLCIRDDVHTTPYGATIYANIIYDFFLKFIHSADILIDDGEYVQPPIELSDFCISSFDIQGDLNENNALLINIDKGCNIQLFAKVNVGPYTPFIDVKSDQLYTFSLMDPWCYYERECLKKISPVLNSTNGEIKISISSAKRRFEILRQPIINETPPKRLPIYQLYCNGCNILDATFTSK